MIEKQINQKAWFMVLPVFLLVAFSAIIPLMTVVNYSFQDTFGSNQFFWVGMDWFKDLIHSERFHDAFLRQITFSGIILAIEIPLGIAIALAMPKKGWGVPVCLISMALPLLIPWNVVGTICRSSAGLISVCSATPLPPWALTITIPRIRLTPGSPLL
jgi:glycerol transport system permease protein